MAMLGVPEDYTRDDVISAFRRKAKLAHPDLGGTAEIFRQFAEARDPLLAAIGIKAAAPTPDVCTRGHEGDMSTRSLDHAATWLTRANTIGLSVISPTGSAQMKQQIVFDLHEVEQRRAHP